MVVTLISSNIFPVNPTPTGHYRISGKFLVIINDNVTYFYSCTFSTVDNGSKKAPNTLQSSYKSTDDIDGDGQKKVY